MKRTLTISLWLALGGAAIAQNPATVRSNAQSAANSASQVSVVAKPAATSVKVVPVQGKTTVAVKPATVAVKLVVQAKPTVVAAKPAVVQAKPTVVQAKPAVVQAKPVVVAAKPAVVQAKPSAASKPAPVQAKPAVVTVKAASQGKPAVVAAQPTPNKTGVQQVKPVAVAVPVHAGAKDHAVPLAAPKVVAVGKTEPHKGEKQPVVAVKSAPEAKVASGDKTDDSKPQAAPAQPSVAQNGRRDPFISPIVTMSSLGSGCSSGKRCLAIDQINLRGVVKSDAGMIAVVVNSAEKAYFLRENDPVFNGYVVKITQDSIVFKEMFHDKLGKPLTRDVTKSITRPVA